MALNSLAKRVMAVVSGCSLALTLGVVVSPGATAAPQPAWEKKFVKEVKRSWKAWDLKYKWKNDKQILRVGKGLCDIYADPGKSSPDGIKYLKSKGLKSGDDRFWVWQGRFLPPVHWCGHRNFSRTVRAAS